MSQNQTHTKALAASFSAIGVVLIGVFIWTWLTCRKGPKRTKSGQLPRLEYTSANIPSFTSRRRSAHPVPGTEDIELDLRPSTSVLDISRNMSGAVDKASIVSDGSIDITEQQGLGEIRKSLSKEKGVESN